eukprot:2643639-Rhodomonas_salina.1
MRPRLSAESESRPRSQGSRRFGKTMIPTSNKAVPRSSQALRRKILQLLRALLSQLSSSFCAPRRRICLTTGRHVSLEARAV